MKDKYDVIVIDAGIGGKNLLVVDQQPAPAGVCYSLNGKDIRLISGR